MTWAWVLVGLTVGSLVGYLVGVFCANASDTYLDERNTQLWWALRNLIEASELYHDENTAALGEAIKRAREALKGE